MDKQIDLKAIFGRFAGREVPLEEKIIDIGGGGYPRLSFKHDPDPTLETLKEEAAKHGLDVRVWIPGTMGTTEVDRNRLNIYIDKDKYGAWKIQPDFHLG